MRTELVRWSNRRLRSIPGAFSFLYRTFGPGKNRSLAVCDKTEIVIEGFPRSANTFAVVAFSMAQPRPVVIAHHLHMASQVLDGVWRGLPVCVLIRDPLEAVRSFVIRHPQLHWKFAFEEYVDFYTAALSVADKCLLVPFPAATSDFGLVTEMINRKFGTQFGVFPHSEENREAVFSEIERISRMHGHGEESKVARPSRQREQISVEIDPDDPVVRKALDVFHRAMGKVEPELLG